MGDLTFGQSAAIAGGQSAVSGLFNVGEARKNYHRQRGLNKQQFQHQQALNTQSFNLEFEQWKRTNFEEQMKQLKKAGLSAGLIYSQGGAQGGTTAGSGGGASGGSAGMAAPMDMRSLAEYKLLDAQADNIKQDTEVKEAQRS